MIRKVVLEKLDFFYDLIRKYRIFNPNGNLGNKKKLSFYLENLFDGVSIENKRVLDIGAGTGVFSIYMSIMGASQIIALEPEMDGSGDYMSSNFKEILQKLNIQNITILNTLFQDIDETDKYDVLLLHNSINHLDEESCCALKEGTLPLKKYLKLLQKLYLLLNKHGIIIISDASRYNFWGMLGMKNPFAPTIEWYNHQSPYVWKKILSQVGFVEAQVRWTSIGQFGRIGSVIFSNPIMAYFLMSHFNLIMKKY